MNLFPVPGNNITQDQTSYLTAPWRAWFDWLLTVLQQNVLARDYGSFYDTSTQSITLTSAPYVVAIGQTAELNNVTADGFGKLTVLNAGVFNLQFSVQLNNINVADQDAQIWLRINGNDVAYSNRVVDVPAVHGVVNGHAVAAWSFISTLAAGDYLQLIWQADSVDVTIAAFSAGIGPAIPSVIANVIKVS